MEVRTSDSNVQFLQTLAQSCATPGAVLTADGRVRGIFGRILDYVLRRKASRHLEPLFDRISKIDVDDIAKIVKNRYLGVEGDLRFAKIIEKLAELGSNEKLANYKDRFIEAVKQLGSKSMNVELISIDKILCLTNARVKACRKLGLENEINSDIKKQFDTKLMSKVDYQGTPCISEQDREGYWKLVGGVSAK